MPPPTENPNTPPRWLDETGKRHWKRIAPRINNMTTASREELGMLCEQYATWRNAIQEGRDAKTIEERREAYKIQRTALADYVRVSKLLGLGSMPPDETADDDLAELLADD